MGSCSCFHVTRTKGKDAYCLYYTSNYYIRVQRDSLYNQRISERNVHVGKVVCLLKQVYCLQFADGIAGNGFCFLLCRLFSETWSVEFEILTTCKLSFFPKENVLNKINSICCIWAKKTL